MPVAKECDNLSLPCAAVDANGNLYVWGVLGQLIAVNVTKVISTCFDDAVTDEELIMLHN